MAIDEPIHDIAHLGSVELLTPKPEQSLWYFRDILGMEVVNSAADSVHLRAFGDYATATLKLTAAAQAGVGCIAWRTTSPAALERRAKAIEEAGLGMGWTNGDFGRGRSYRLHDPDGHVMEIYYDEQRYIAPAEQEVDAQEPAAEISRPRRRRAAGRSPGAAGERCDRESESSRPRFSASSCANRCASTRARPKSGHG